MCEIHCDLHTLSLRYYKLLINIELIHNISKTNYIIYNIYHLNYIYEYKSYMCVYMYGWVITILACLYAFLHLMCYFCITF